MQFSQNIFKVELFWPLTPKTAHSKENNLQENFQPAVPANTVTQYSNLEVHNGSGIMPNIPQNIQNDKISPPLHEIAHNPRSGIMFNMYYSKQPK